MDVLLRVSNALESAECNNVRVRKTNSNAFRLYAITPILARSHMSPSSTRTPSLRLLSPATCALDWASVCNFLPLCPSHARQSRATLAHHPGQCFCDAPQHARPQFHVVARYHHCCVPPQPHLKPLRRSHRWHSPHSPYVVGA
jgi:hypothetical protein